MNNARSDKSRRSPEQWRRLIEQQQAGHQSIKAFCQEQGIAYATFLYHKRKLAESTPEQGALPPAPVGESGFIEVQAPEAGGRWWDVELALGDGIVLRVRRW